MRRLPSASHHFRFLFAKQRPTSRACSTPRQAKKEPKPEPPIDPNVREVQERLQRALGLKVHIEDHNGRGSVIIEYAKLEDFDTLLEQLGVRERE